MAAEDITTLLHQLHNGNPEVESRLAEAVYHKLHQMARHFMSKERADHSLQPTILVHDAYQELVRASDYTWENRSHFYAVAAQAMRRMLIDHARAHNAVKRGGGQVRVDLDRVTVFNEQNCDEWLALDEAMNRLAQLDARQCRVVELKFFGGMTDEEVAHVLTVSTKTVKRDWATAKGWLHARLAQRVAV